MAFIQYALFFYRNIPRTFFSSGTFCVSLPDIIESCAAIQCPHHARFLFNLNEFRVFSVSGWKNHQSQQQSNVIIHVGLWLVSCLMISQIKSISSIDSSARLSTQSVSAAILLCVDDRCHCLIVCIHIM